MARPQRADWLRRLRHKRAAQTRAQREGGGHQDPQPEPSASVHSRQHRRVLCFIWLLVNASPGSSRLQLKH
eukprot:1227990-Prymnesium_polylepis.1